MVIIGQMGVSRIDVVHHSLKPGRPVATTSKVFLLITNGVGVISVNRYGVCVFELKRYLGQRGVNVQRRMDAYDVTVNSLPISSRQSTADPTSACNSNRRVIAWLIIDDTHIGTTSSNIT